MSDIRGEQRARKDVRVVFIPASELVAALIRDPITDYLVTEVRIPNGPNGVLVTLEGNI